MQRTHGASCSHGRRTPQRRSALPVSGELLLPLPRSEGGGSLLRRRRQRSAEDRHPGRRSVIFLEHKLLYARKEEIPEEEYTIPLGQAAVKREGKDISIISWSREVNFAMEAAAKLAEQGIEAEVLDLRTLVPLDWDAIVKTVSKTHNAIIVSEEVKRGSYAGELSAEISEELFDELDAPVERVCGLNICSPFSPVLEDQNFPIRRTSWPRSSAC